MPTPDPLNTLKTVAADVTAAEAKAVSLRAKATVWVAANPGKVVSIGVAVALLLAWKLL